MNFFVNICANFTQTRAHVGGFQHVLASIERLGFK